MDVRPFIANMALAYTQADLVVCRAGATTLAELACASLPAVLIPYPHAARDHQRANARWYADLGAACILEDGPLEVMEAALARSLDWLMRDPSKRSEMAQAMQRNARPDAARTVARRIIESQPSDEHGSALRAAMAADSRAI